MDVNENDPIPVSTETPVPIPVTVVAPPEKDPLLLDLDIPGPTSVPSPLVEAAPSIAPIASPLPVLIAAEQHPVPVVIEATPDKPLPITASEPLPVVVQNTSQQPIRPDVVKGEGATLAPTTTEQQDEITAGQRAINRIWENTQSRIALMVVISGVLVNSIVILFIIFLDKEVSVTQLALISISLQFINLTTGIVIGFYFSRTNHSAQGGVGPKVADAPYTGR